MAFGQSSGTTAYNPAGSSLLVDAFDRIGIFDLENKHIISAQRSMNLLATSDWSNRGANLFKFSEIVIPLIPGIIQYNLTRDVSAVYDCFRRQYSMNGPQNYPTAFSTVLGSPNVTIAIPGNSSPVGSYIGVQIPVAVAGLVIYGFYQVIANPTANTVTVDARSNAAATVTAGGSVPVFTTTQNSQTVFVNLAVHGLTDGDPFYIPVATQVGGLSLFGSYIIQNIIDANNFTILASSNALASTSAPENGGQSYIAVQNQIAPYTDILMTQLSRTDYAGQSDKTAPGAPTTLWVNKQIIPQLSVWPVTDFTGPYELHMWAMYQIQDINTTGGQTLDLPTRFFYAFVMDLARDLSMKFAPALYATLKVEAGEAWQRAADSDLEPVSTFILPLLPNGL